MRIKKFSEEINQGTSDNINTMPIMNLFVILIPFLLITTVFVETVVFQLHLPQKPVATVTPLSASEQEKITDQLVVVVTADGVRIGVNDVLSDYIPSGTLKKKLADVKKRYTEREDIIIRSEPAVTYQRIIDVMDMLVSVGFSQIGIAGNK